MIEIETLELTNRYPVLAECAPELAKACCEIIEALRNGNTMYVCGNGGSAADAEHIAGELIKNFALPRPLNDDLKSTLKARYHNEGTYLADRLQRGLRVIALTGHCALSTAMANDIASDLIFAQQVVAFGKAGDVLLGISTSGNSANVCHAMRIGQAIGLHTIGLSGKTGGLLSSLCDRMIKVPETETYRIQELHLPVYHFMCMTIEKILFS